MSDNDNINPAAYAALQPNSGLGSGEYAPQRSREEMVLLGLCIAGATGIAPFAVYRAIEQSWLAAVIDAAIVAVVVAIFTYVWRTRKVRVPSIILTLSYMSVMVAVNYITGPQLIYWAYPTMVAAYFLVRPGEALVINAVALLALMPALMLGTTPIETAGLLITLVLNNSFAYLYTRYSLKHQDVLSRMTIMDPLTGVGNRASFADHISKSIAETARFGTRYYLIAVDVDHFRSLNERFGTSAGDFLLIRLAALCQGRVRHVDRVYRLGADEFAIIAMGIDLTGAIKVAEQLRTLVAQAQLLPETPVSISIGIAGLQPNDTLEKVRTRAEDALYLAKQEGGDCVHTEEDLVRRGAVSLLRSKGS